MNASRTVKVRYLHNPHDGAQGPQGPAGQAGKSGPWVPPPMLWERYPSGYTFRAGADGEDRRDVVLERSGDNLYAYSCKATHVKGSNNPPSQDTTHWQPTDAGNFHIVATEILLAAAAYIDLLSTNGIRVFESGAVVAALQNGPFPLSVGSPSPPSAPFRVSKAGKMYCTGAEVAGDITADTLRLKVATTADNAAGVPDGALCFCADDITLPTLPVGHMRVIKVVNPQVTRTSPTDLVLRPADSTVRISTDFGIFGATSATKTITAAGYNSDKYIELLGMNYAGYTYWLFKEL